MLRYVWDKLGIFVNVLLENTSVVLVAILVIFALSEPDYNKKIFGVVTCIPLIMLYIRNEIYKHIDKKFPKTDSPTPQNWVCWEVLVRGKDDFHYVDFVVLTNLDNHNERIIEYYKKDGKEVLDIQVRYISKRI
jgi:hypothetical protein